MSGSVFARGLGNDLTTAVFVVDFSTSHKSAPCRRSPVDVRTGPGSIPKRYVNAESLTERERTRNSSSAVPSVELKMGEDIFLMRSLRSKRRKVEMRSFLLSAAV